MASIPACLPEQFMVIDVFSPPARISVVRGLLVRRPVRRGLQIRLGQPGVVEDASDGVDVERLTGVRGADQGEQLRAARSRPARTIPTACSGLLELRGYIGARAAPSERTRRPSGR